MQKNDSIELAESESDKKIRRLVFLGIRIWLHPKTSDSATLLFRRKSMLTILLLLKLISYSAA